MTKNDLLASIRRDRAAFDDVIVRVGEGRMEEPALDEGWSVKDVLAHISSWEKIGMATVRNNQPVEAPPPGQSTTNTTDLVNQKIYENNRDRPLADIRADAARSHAELLTMVEGMSDDALSSILGGATEGQTAGQIISENSDAHNREHTEQIGRWLDGE